jgi:small nuclear ribonucleoprotein (snRNP)-like protein
MGRVGDKVQVILTNNYSYTGTILEDDSFFIVILDKFSKKVSIGKKDIQVIREVQI